MAGPCGRCVLVVALLWLFLSSIAVAEPLQSNSEDSGLLWELPIIVPTCDSSTPVCLEGGIDYESACHATAAGVRILETGPCKKEIKQTASCNVKCFRADPVCGEDATTYWCGAAEAKCAGVGVAHTGFCDPKSGGAGMKGTPALQSLFLVHIIWLVVAGFLVIAGLL